MFDTTIEINGKKHTKTKPTLNDYRRLLEYNKRNEGKSFLSDSTPIEEALELIAEWFGDVSISDIEATLDLQEIFDLYRQIESNVTEVFTGVPLKQALKTLHKVLKP